MILNSHLIKIDSIIIFNLPWQKLCPMLASPELDQVIIYHLSLMTGLQVQSVSFVPHIVL